MRNNNRPRKKITSIGQVNQGRNGIIKWERISKLPCFSALTWGPRRYRGEWDQPRIWWNKTTGKIQGIQIIVAGVFAHPFPVTVCLAVYRLPALLRGYFMWLNLARVKDADLTYAMSQWKTEEPLCNWLLHFSFCYENVLSQGIIQRGAEYQPGPWNETWNRSRTTHRQHKMRPGTISFDWVQEWGEHWWLWCRGRGRSRLQWIIKWLRGVDGEVACIKSSRNVAMEVSKVNQ